MNLYDLATFTSVVRSRAVFSACLEHAKITKALGIRGFRFSPLHQPPDAKVWAIMFGSKYGTRCLWVSSWLTSKPTQKGSRLNSMIRGTNYDEGHELKSLPQ